MDNLSLSFKTRLLVIFFFLTLPPPLLVGIISYRNYYHAAWDHTRFAAGQTMANLTREMDDIFAEAEQFLEIGSYTVTESFLAGRGDSYDNAKAILALMNLYRGKEAGKTDIIDIYLVGINGEGISEREGVFPLRSEFDQLPSLSGLVYGSETPAVLQFSRADVSGYWNKPKWQRAAVTDRRLSLGLARYLRDSIRKVVLGVAIAEIDPDRLDRICREQSRAGDLLYAIFDRDGKKLFGEQIPIAADDWSLVWARTGGEESGSFVHEFAGHEHFFIHSASTTTGLRVIGQAGVDEMMAGAYRIRNITIASVVGCVLFTVLLYAFISDGLTKPLTILKNKMRRASHGDLDVRFQSRRQDEFAELGDSFNTMIKRIRQLLDQTRQEHELAKRSQFRALQAQINPHFLYNTLDSILWMAQASRREELTEMVVALSKFFRLSLNSGRDIVTVAEEVEQARNYLIIQRMRYRDIIEYDIAVDPDILQFRMIKLILQPLIENAIYHGLKNKRGGGTIWIRGGLRRDDDTVVFTVRDNGKGIPPERLVEIQAELASPAAAEASDSGEAENEKGGYALKNVNERIQLSYGVGYGVTLESRLDAGTSAILEFPALEQEDVETFSR